MAMTAPPGGVQVSGNPDVIGFPSSFVFGPELIFPGAQQPVYTGSQLGVPAVDQIAGETPDSGQATGAAAAVAYGKQTAGGAPHQQPVFWSIILVTLGVVLITHAADVSLRGLR